MALVSERWSARKLSKSSGGWSHTRIFDVTGATSLDDAIDAVETHDATTAHNAQSPLSTLMYVESRDGEETGFGFWTVTVTYSSSPAGRHFDPGNPLDEPTVWRVVVSTEQYSSPADATGKAVLNAAGQAFSSDPPGYEKCVTLIGTRAEPFFDIAQAIAYTNAVNNANVTFDNAWALTKGQMICRAINPVTPITGDEPYVMVEYVIELREGFTTDSDGYADGFKLRILNEGTEGHYTGGKGSFCRLRVDPYTKKDVPVQVSSPVLLDTDGTPLSSDVYVMCPESVDADGYTTPIANPAPQTGVVYETTTEATFIKIFPAGTKFKNLTDLGL